MTKCNLRFLGLLAIFALATAHSAVNIDLPGDSIFNLDVPLTDQAGRDKPLSAWRGQATIVSLFYTSCPYMCPLIIDTARLTDRELNAAQRARLGFLLVSIDADRDGPAQLLALAETRKIDTSRWTLARTDAGHVRKLAAVLGIQYRALESGEFSHSSKLILLDGEGRIVASTDTMGKIDEAFVAAVKGAVTPP